MNKILLIHCGGTLGMVQGLYGYTTMPGSLRSLIFSNSNISSKNFCFKERKCLNCLRMNGQVDSFITTPIKNGAVALVDIYEFPEIMDSSNATINEWCTIVRTIEKFYDSYDGFLIVHGTDTLSYAASCVTFMIKGLTLPIIFTGSMLPMAVESSDAERNLIESIESCLLIGCPGVYICFNSWLHHGVRTTKISSDKLNSFFSQNPIRIDELISRKRAICNSTRRKQNYKPTFFHEMSPYVGLFKVYPSIHSSYFKAVLDVYKAVILETYGTGTFPSNRTDLLDMISNYIKIGGYVVSVSQCADGNVYGIYETSNVLVSVGVLSGRNMTTESAFAKLSFLLANRPHDIEQCFSKPFYGEIEEEDDSMSIMCFHKLS